MEQGALSAFAEMVLEGYRIGIFPMAERGKIRFYSADPRGVLPLEEFHVPRRLARRLRRNPFDLRVNTAFTEVMRGCAERDSTWISNELVEVYSLLHRQGQAHSVESWLEGRLVGGLYGVTQGGAFFGESMFAREPDASKAALVELVDRLKQRGFVLLDCQMVTPHTQRFGARWISGAEYRELLARALPLKRSFTEG
ncbi:MAG: leucyl/phenylalanyl-tRNA--protein transferase [Candidatus Eremiobacterota bacterium]